MSIETRPGIGANLTVVLGDETTAGVVSTVLDTRYDCSDESIVNEKSEIESASIRGGREMAPSVDGTSMVTGSVSSEMAPQGFGKLLRHTLGTHTTIEGSDGVFARVSVDFKAGEPYFECTEDYVEGFPSAGSFAIVSQNNDLSLYTDGAFYQYEEFKPCSRTTVSVAADIDVTNSILSLADINQINRLNGQAIGGPATGIVRLQVNDVIHTLQYDNVNIGTLSLNITHIDGVLLAIIPAGTGLVGADIIGRPVITRATFFNSAGLFVGYNNASNGYGLASNIIPSGSFVFNMWSEYIPVTRPIYTHYFQGHKELPTGLTMEVFRDAANFVYTGLKVNEWQFTQDTDALATQTHSFIGMSEHTTVQLAAPVAIGDSVIVVKAIRLGQSAEPIAFPPTGILTIGERTNIRYTGYNVSDSGSFVNSLPANDGKGYYVFDVVPADITTSHLIGEPLASRSQLTSPLPDILTDSRYTMVEGMITMGCSIEEVMSATFTVSNNLADTKKGFGSSTLLHVIEGDRGVSLSMNVEFDDHMFYQRYLKGDFSTVILSYDSISEEYIVDNVAYPHRFVTYFPRVKYSGTTPNVSGKEFIAHDMPGKSYKDTRYTAQIPSIVAIYTNTVATDY